MKDNREFPLISVVVPMYNVEGYIENCLRSIILQNYRNLEIIVIDDGSTDKSLEIARKMASDDNRIKLFSKVNEGPASARNEGIRKATGEWLLMVDADDSMVPCAIFELYQNAVKTGANLVCGSYYLKSENSSHVEKRQMEEFFSCNLEEIHKYFLTYGRKFNQSWGKLFRLSIFDNIEYPVGHLYEDVACMPYILEAAGSLSVIDKPVYNYLLRDGSVTESADLNQKAECMERRRDNCLFYEKHYPNLSRYAHTCFLDAAFFLMGSVAKDGFNKNAQIWNRVVNEVSKNIKVADRSEFDVKMAISLFKVNPKLAAKSFSAYSSIKNRRRGPLTVKRRRAKIAFFGGNLTHSGGTERVLTTLANSLSRRGFEVVVISLTGEGKSFFELNEGIKLYWLGSKDLKTNILRNLRKLRKISKEEKPDFWIDVDSILFFYSGIIRLFNKGINLISWEHFNYYMDFEVNKGLRKISRFLVTRFGKDFVVLSDEDMKNYKENEKVRAKLHRIYNPTPFGISEECVDYSQKTVVTVGRLTHVKGYDMLLRSWKIVEERMPDWELLFTGDGDERDNLKKLSEDLNLSNVKFLGKTDEVKAAYKGGSVFALSSRNEGFPMVLLEAMSFGLPIVTFDCRAGIRELVDDGQNGLIAPCFDEKAYAENLCTLMASEETRVKYGMASKQKIEAFSIDEITDEWERLFMR